MDVAKRLAEVAANKKLAEQYGVSNLQVSGPVYAGGKQLTPGSTEYWEALQRFNNAPKTSSIGTATGSYGGPGGGVNFTTAPGTVGSTIGGTSGTGGAGGAGGAPGAAGAGNAMADAALKRIEQVGMGNQLPMDEAQKSRMYSAQTDATAGAEAQQQAALRRTVAAGGGSLYDPSTGAAEREFTENRQLANQGAKRDIDTNAQAQNFEAQFAANRLLAAQKDGGINSGNPYGQQGRYGTGDGGSQQYSESDPRRGGNIQSYGGYNLDPNQMNNTPGNPYPTQPKQGTATGGTTQPQQGGETYQQSSGGYDTTMQGLQNQAGSAQAKIDYAVSQLSTYGKSKYQQAIGWGYDPAKALAFAQRNA